MITRILLITAVFVLTSPAQAEAGPHGDAPAAPGGSQPRQPIELYNALDEAAAQMVDLFGEDETCPRALDLPKVAVPVTDNDRLAGYAYITPRICLKRSSRSDHFSNIHFLSDRLLRAAHRTPFQVLPDGELSHGATQASMLEAVAEFIRPEDIDRLDLLGDDIQVIH